MVRKKKPTKKIPKTIPIKRKPIKRTEKKKIKPTKKMIKEKSK